MTRPGPASPASPASPPSGNEPPPVAAADPVALAARAEALAAATGRRVLVGVTGAPGAGKSTLAAAVVARLRSAARLVPMDGYHLAHRVLDAAGLAAVKGAPQTFDAAGYLAVLERLARPDGTTVYAPEFRREIEEPIAGALAVPPEVPIVVTEGNYLLLDDPPWDRVRGLLDEVWFMDIPEDVRLRRLVDRHVAYGRGVDEATERALTGSDGRNAALIRPTARSADLLLRPVLEADAQAANLTR